MKNKNIIVEDDEVWKKIDEHGDKYEVSDMGKIKNFITGKMCPEETMKLGHKRIILYHENKKQYIGIHYLVAKYFIDNPENKEDIAHLDGNTANNRVTNLN